MGAPDPLIGEPIFGGYLVTRRIGAGGMGAVYLLENVELGRKLAAKVLLPERLASEQLTRRFLAEARAASAIRHRNIIEIIDSATLEDGRHYILMEYLEGQTLRGFVKGRGRLPVEVTLAVLAQVCSGLEAAHARGIVHRDLKPSNIFIAPQPDNPYFAKILDFGIAKLDDPELAGDVTTKSQSVAGTPNYMSPEQARAMRDVDHRTDIYAVGVIAFELLTGRVPYYANSVGDLVFQQTSNRPPAPRDYVPDVPEGWNDLIRAAIDFDPLERPASARALAEQMIAATPDGERIARAAAPLLFSSSLPEMPEGGVAALVPSWNDASIPDGATGGTQSMAPGPEAAMVTPGGGLGHEATEAASPQALRSGGASAEEGPSTLGGAASEVSRQIDIGTSRRRWWMLGGGLAAVAAAAVLAVMLTGGNGDEPRPATAPSADTDADTETDTAFAPVVEPIDDRSGVDAGAEPEVEQLMERSRRNKKPKKRKRSGTRTGTGTGKDEPDPHPDDLFEHRK